MKNFIFLSLFIGCFTSAYAGLDQFTDLIFVEEWLIERKIDLMTDEISCRASIPSNASWFGARIRLGRNNELIKPVWISKNEDQLLDSKLARVKKLLNECRSGVLFLPESL